MSSHLTGYLRNGVHPKPHGNHHSHATNWRVRHQGRDIGDARRQQPAPAEAAVDAARPARHGEEDERRARRAITTARWRVLREIMPTRTADQWEEFLQANHVPACRVRTMGEALADPQLATRGVVHRHEGATGVEGGFGVPLAAFTLRAWRPAHRLSPAGVGRAQWRDFRRARVRESCGGVSEERPGGWCSPLPQGSRGGVSPRWKLIAGGS